MTGNITESPQILKILPLLRLITNHLLQNSLLNIRRDRHTISRLILKFLPQPIMTKETPSLSSKHRKIFIHYAPLFLNNFNRTYSDLLTKISLARRSNFLSCSSVILRINIFVLTIQSIRLRKEKYT